MWLPIPKFGDEILAITKLLIRFPQGAPARTAAAVSWIVFLDYAIASAFSIASKDIVLENMSNEHWLFEHDLLSSPSLANAVH